MITYIVQPGDTLFGIAQRFGVTMDAIIRANNIANPNLIFVGQVLRIPVAAPPPAPPGPPTIPPGAREITYIVQPGDTLTSIAQRFGSSVTAIVRRNRITNPNFIQVGQTLIIPVFAPPFPPPPTPPPPIPPPTPPPPTPPAPEQRIESRIVDGLLFVLRVDKAVYRRGEPIVMTLSKSNISNRTITLDYTTSQRVDFRLRHRGQIIWTWSEGRVFLPVTGRETFRPGETKVYREVFTDTARLETGIYRLVGWNLATPQERLTVEFRIRA